MRWSGCSELPAVDRCELRVDEWLRAKDELLDGLDGDVETRGIAGWNELCAIDGVRGNYTSPHTQNNNKRRCG